MENELLKYLSDFVPSINANYWMLQVVLLVGFFLLLMTDRFTGIKNAKVAGKYLSSKDRNTASKAVEYTLLLLLANGFSVFVPSPMAVDYLILKPIFVLGKAIGFLAYFYVYHIEFKSIGENSEIFGGFFKFLTGFWKGFNKVAKDK